MTPAEKFASNLRRLRKESGYSQEALSYLAGMNYGRVGYYEQGKVIPKARGLLKLAGALGKTPNDLLAGIEWQRGDDRSPGRLVVREGA